MSDENVSLKIFRYDPDSDDKPYYQNFEVPYREGLLLLTAVKYVRENYDDTLAFRDYCCGCSWCMSCLMSVDGKGMRTCSKVLAPGDRILVEPMKGYPIVKDLVVDFGVTVTTEEGVFKKMQGTVLRKVKEDHPSETDS